MQSILSKKTTDRFKSGEKTGNVAENLKKTVVNSRLPLPWGPVTRRLLLRTVTLYTFIYLSALLLVEFSDTQRVQAFATGLLMPGAGFLYWANPAGDWAGVFNFLFLGAILCFGIAVVLWFATGNIIAPILVWISSAAGAAFITMYLPVHVTALPWTFPTEALSIVIPILVALAFVAKAETSEKQQQQYQRDQNLVASHPQTSKRTVSTSAKPANTELTLKPGAPELSYEDLQKMRALLDRSLQPVDKFEGFDWIDQFQTASLRYQINFVSYALSIASQVHLPAAQAYMHTAQANLASKLLDHRVWGYWQLENMWGNLRTSADPVTHDNIMLSGFLSAQFGLARNLVGLVDFDEAESLIFKTKRGKEFRYSLAKINQQLTDHYHKAPYGLLACEPNWIFPLCNAITATGIRSLDTQTGSANWDTIASGFRNALQTEFTSSNGLLVPFRSLRTGIAAPMIGGGAMQSLPCLFLNSLLPDIASSQWQLCAENLRAEKGRRHMWPIDIGNYRLNRSASYGACAATAVEMGDSDTAKRILEYLDEDYPLVVDEGVAHRPKASLWAHALEFCAIAGDHNALQTATTGISTNGPVISKADYPDVLMASATHTDKTLRAVVYPGSSAGLKNLSVGKLKPHSKYVLHSSTATTSNTVDVTADHQGNATFNVMVDGRTELNLAPVNGSN